MLPWLQVVVVCRELQKVVAVVIAAVAVVVIAAVAVDK